MSDKPHLIAITACPSGVAHTYMAAENLERAAEELGYTMDVETHGQIGIENAFSQEAINRAEAVIIAADSKIELDRFAGKRVVVTGVAEGIHQPARLIRRGLEAEPIAKADNGSVVPAKPPKQGLYRILMNGVSHMIPFVVVGGLMIAIAYGIGGTPTPGGLVIPEGSFYETQASSFQTVLERQRNRRGAKQRIAAAAAALVRDGDAVMIEAGTTTALVAAALTGRHAITVVTNSTLALAAARLDPGLRMILAGGRFHPGMESFTGSDTLGIVGGYNVRLAFVGTDGFSAEHGLTTPFTDGADVVRAMCRQADEAWLVADSSKLGRAGFVRVLGLDQVTGVVTDKGIGQVAADEIRALGTKVIVA